jgi:EAL domain-containing protein (putative c-di-GMP-specific phosphodiesterase class I)
LQSRMWLDEGINPISMSVNLSAVQLRRKDFLEDVKTIIQKCDMNPQYLNFELTESVLMNGADLTLSLLHSLKSIGITLSIDDFGTDYSSLSYLKRFPVDILKIDRTFISDITIDQDDEAITSAIISMGRSLRLKTIAEGVETKEQLSFLQALHCDEAQGNLFIEPLPANDIHQYLKAGYINV